jgi:exopolysaccharide biosynthesis protein
MRPKGLLVLLLCAASVFTNSAHAQKIPSQISWQSLKPGIETARFNFNAGAVFSSSIVLVRSDPNLFRVQVIRSSEFGWKRADIRSLCRKSGATACINSNFFDEQGKPLGVVINRGIIHNKIHKGGGTITAVLYATPKVLAITHRDEFSTHGVVEATQAGPRLLAAGRPIDGVKSSVRSSNLSGACIDREGRFIMFRVASGMFGCTTNQLQELLMHPSINCIDAINFDGGGSSQLFISAAASGSTDEAQEENYQGEDEVPVAVGIFEN